MLYGARAGAEMRAMPDPSSSQTHQVRILNDEGDQIHVKPESKLMAPTEMLPRESGRGRSSAQGAWKHTWW